MTEIKKDSKFKRIETLGINAGNFIVDKKGNIGIGIDAFTSSSDYISKKNINYKTIVMISIYNFLS